jgi:hypothetical protein
MTLIERIHINMPLHIIIGPKKVVLSNKQVADVLDILRKVLATVKMKFSPFTSESTSSNVDPTTAQLSPSTTKRREGCWAKLAYALEYITGDHHGSNEVLLDGMELTLDPPGVILRDEYINFLNHLMDQEKITSQQTEAENISSPFVLVREILIRLATAALSKELNIKLDGDEIIFMLERFVDEVQKSNALKTYSLLGKPENSRMRITLDTDHDQWIHDFRNVISAIQLIHTNERSITDILRHLRNLHFSIMRLILAELDQKNYTCADYSENWISRKLRGCETKILSSNGSSHQQTVALLSVQREKQVSTWGPTTMDDAQRHIINCFNSDQPSILYPNQKKRDALKNLYDCFNKLNLLLQVVSEFDLLITTMGWVPILLGIIQFETLEKLIFTHSKECLTLALSSESPLLTPAHSKLPAADAILHYGVSKIMRNALSTSMKNFLQIERFRDPSTLRRLVNAISGSLTSLEDVQKSLALSNIPGGIKLISFEHCKLITFPIKERRERDRSPSNPRMLTFEQHRAEVLQPPPPSPAVAAASPPPSQAIIFPQASISRPASAPIAQQPSNLADSTAERRRKMLQYLQKYDDRPPPSGENSPKPAT